MGEGRAAEGTIAGVAPSPNLWGSGRAPGCALTQGLAGGGVEAPAPAPHGHRDVHWARGVRHGPWAWALGMCMGTGIGTGTGGLAGLAVISRDPLPLSALGPEGGGGGLCYRLCGPCSTSLRCPPPPTQDALEWGGGAPPPPPPLEGPQPTPSHWQVPPSMAFVTDSNRPQPLWRRPPIACQTASGAPLPF